MPMSASCVVNRADLLAMLEEVRAALPDSLAQAQELIGGHEQLAEQARQEAERIIECAHAQRSTLISDTEVARQSQDEADRILAEARRDAEEIRAEADDYVDSKLANFEVVLTKTIGSVDRGREKLLGRGPGPDETGTRHRDDDAPEHSADPRHPDPARGRLRGRQAGRLRGRPLQDPRRGRPRPAEAARPDRLRRRSARTWPPRTRPGGRGTPATRTTSPTSRARRPARSRRRPPQGPSCPTAARSQAHLQPPVPDAGPGMPDPALAAAASDADPGTGRRPGYQQRLRETGYADPAYAEQQAAYAATSSRTRTATAGPVRLSAAGLRAGPEPAAGQGQPQGYDPNYGWQQPDVQQGQIPSSSRAPSTRPASSTPA